MIGLARIRNVSSYGYYRFDERPTAKARYKYVRKAYFFPKAFEKQLEPFLGVDLLPRVERGRIVLEPKTAAGK